MMKRISWMINTNRPRTRTMMKSSSTPAPSERVTASRSTAGVRPRCRPRAGQRSGRSPSPSTGASGPCTPADRLRDLQHMMMSQIPTRHCTTGLMNSPATGMNPIGGAMKVEHVRPDEGRRGSGGSEGDRGHRPLQARTEQAGDDGGDEPEYPEYIRPMAMKPGMFGFAFTVRSLVSRVYLAGRINPRSARRRRPPHGPASWTSRR